MCLLTFGLILYPSANRQLASPVSQVLCTFPSRLRYPPKHGCRSPFSTFHLQTLKHLALHAMTKLPSVLNAAERKFLLPEFSLPRFLPSATVQSGAAPRSPIAKSNRPSAEKQTLLTGSSS